MLGAALGFVFLFDTNFFLGDCSLWIYFHASLGTWCLYTGVGGQFDISGMLVGS